MFDNHWLVVWNMFFFYFSISEGLKPTTRYNPVKMWNTPKVFSCSFAHTPWDIPQLMVFIISIMFVSYSPVSMAFAHPTLTAPRSEGKVPRCSASLSELQCNLCDLCWFLGWIPWSVRRVSRAPAENKSSVQLWPQIPRSILDGYFNPLAFWY